MSLTRQERDQAIEWVRDFFSADLTKVALSVLILLSVTPMGWVRSFGMVFFGIFAIELSLRGMVFFHDVRKRDLSRTELLFLLFDLVATLSFLPVEALWDDARFLRLFRLSRMLMLLGYWAPVVRDVWYILVKRERRYQISFVVVFVVILSFTSALLLEHFEVRGVDFDSDGVSRQESFWAMLWWSFRQIESPDNLLANPDSSLAFFSSIFLTLSGLFLFSFLVGIGASVVEELVGLSKERRLGARRHTVICNISPHSEVLLKELVAYYTKSFRQPRIVTLGPAAQRYDYMHHNALRKVRYRQGQPLSSHDLIKVDTDRATRVILLADAKSDTSDSEVVSQILSVRETNRECIIYAEMLKGQSVHAALHAGGDRVVPIMPNRLMSSLLANIIALPGVEEIYSELFTSLGDEIYTCIYDQGVMAGRTAPSAALMPFGELLRRGHQAHGVLLLGYLIDDARTPGGIHSVINPGGSTASRSAPRPAVPPVDRLRGFFGVAQSFESMRGFVESLPDVSAHSPTPSSEAVPRMGLCPGFSTARRFLICGYHPGMVSFCEELFFSSRVEQIFFMLPDGESLAAVSRAFEEHAEERDHAPGSHHVVFSVIAQDRIHISIPAEPGARGTIQLMSGDWSEERVLVAQPGAGYRLSDMDGVLLTYTPEEVDPDARTALALLKLIRLKEAGLRPSLRLFCEVKSSEKADLFQRRFAQMGNAARGACPTVTVVAAESMRNAFLAQATFVPGISTIYGELLSEEGMCLSRLRPLAAGDAGAMMSFGDLLSVLYERDGYLALAVTLEEPGGGRRLVLNPKPRSEDYTFAAGQLVGVYAVGRFSGLPRSSYCDGCHARAGSAISPGSLSG